MEKYVSQIEEALSKNHSVVLGARCKVRFNGRAESNLAKGDRIILIKPDKTLIVHQPQGNNPVNYLKPGANHGLYYEDEKLFLKSRNLQLKEYMDIEITRLHFFNSCPLDDACTVVVSGTEKQMSDMLYDNPEMIEEGFKPVSREEQTKFGFIDVFGYDKNNVLTIIECKRFSANLNSVDQLRRYVEKVKTSKGISGVRGIIAAPKITANALKMLEEWGFEFKSIKPPKYMERYDKKQKKLDFF